MDTQLSDERASAMMTAPASPARVTRLPIELTSFVGREQELAAAHDRLTSTRLLTLTGAAGSGKTRLALELATREATAYEELAWVELAPVAHGALVPGTVLTALGVAEQPGRSATDALIAVLRDRRTLLILDNCEHLIDACASLAHTLLRACPELCIIGTSREALGVAGEVAWLVPPLSLPAAGEPLERSEAVQLFVARARAVAPRFTLDATTASAVEHICRRLDGLPLALELAAARLRALPAERLAERLDDQFRVLVSGSRTALPRHQTLRAAIDWSYALLSEPERWLLDHLAVFSGSFTLEAAEAICVSGEIHEDDVLDLIASLVEKSLLVLLDVGDEARYRLLESVRQYAAERLAVRGDEEVHRDMHAAYFARVAAAADPLLTGPRRRELTQRLLHDLDNLRAAIEWSAERDPLLSLRIIGKLNSFWYSAGLWTEGRERAAAAVAHPATAAPTSERGEGLFTDGALAAHQGHPDIAIPRLEECLTIARAIGDGQLEAYGNCYLALAYGQRGDARAVEPARFALEWARRSGDRYAQRLSLLILGVYYWQAREVEQARSAMDDAVRVAREFAQPRELGVALSCLARVDIDMGEIGTGVALARESLLAFAEDPQFVFVARSLELLGGLACRGSGVLDGVVLFGAAASVREFIGSRPYLADSTWLDTHLQRARTVLSEEEFERAWQRGRAMSVEQAIAFALGDAAFTVEQLAQGANVVGRRIVTEPAPAVASGRTGRETTRASDADRAAAATDASSASTRAAVPELCVRALGTLEISRGGEPMPATAWSYAKPRELLLFLLSHPEGRTREQVGAALWPDASTAQVRNNFHVTVHHLRKALGGADWVRLEGGRYRLAPDRVVDFDVARFEAAATEALRAARRGKPSAEALRAAVSLYGGEFASSESMGDWHLELCDRLSHLYVEARLVLADALIREERYAEAVEVLERLCREDPLDEGAVRRLMTALGRSGDRTAAIQRYHRLRDALRRELGASTGRESAALHDRLQRGDPI
jgi:predicted ATPase/DNA-binding SARP family transcriptional activator